MPAPKSPTRRPTIDDVARVAQVSKGAVSFALNGRPGVGQQQILRLVSQLFEVATGEIVGFGAAAVFGPEPLRVTRESFVQPDVAPPPCGHRVAEPRVG